MKKTIYILWGVLVFGTLLVGCREDKPDPQSIFIDPVEKPSTFDRWLLDNYVDDFNVRVLYRLTDIETDFDYNVIPAELTKAKQMCVLMKHLWIDAYVEVAGDGVHFMRATVPKLLHLVGSPEYNPQQGTIRLGQAEGGMKITITDVNSLDPINLSGRDYFGTLHHEFAHVLHQTKNYSEEFQTISAADYLPTTWFNRNKETEFLPLGFITAYAGAKPDEDFVELISRYATYTDAEWNRRLAIAGDQGRAIILRKLDIVRKYLKDNWKVDLETLHQVVQRRMAEVPGLNLDNLDF